MITFFLEHQDLKPATNLLAKPYYCLQSGKCVMGDQPPTFASEKLLVPSGLGW